MNELATISKLQSAKLYVREVRELDEIKRLADQSEVLKSYARAQRLSREIQDDIAEYALYTTRQMGFISAGLEKSKTIRQNTEYQAAVIGVPKKEVLATAGIDIRRANEVEKLAAIPESRFAEIIAKKKESGELTKTAVMKAVAKPHIANNSGNNEWYTPREYIDAVYAVMGGIDLDPASNEIANKGVQAARYYSIEDNGLSQPWAGRVWLNPPYAAELIPQFIEKLKNHVESGDIEQAIVLVNNATETAWFNTLISVASAIIFPKTRVRFYMLDGKTGAPLQGQALVCIGGSPETFMDIFKPFGWGRFYERRDTKRGKKTADN